MTAVGKGGGAYEVAYWPRPSRHSHSDFRRFFSMGSNALLAYRFGEGAKRRVPSSEQPCFDSGW